MDKNTYSHYGWIVVVVIIICILISGMPGFRMIIETNIKSSVTDIKDAGNKALDNITLEGGDFGGGGGVDTTKLVPGLYYTGTDELIKDWDTLLNEDIIEVVDGALYLLNGYNVYEDESASLAEDNSASLFGTGFLERYLSGDLVVAPGVTEVGDDAFTDTKLFTGITLPDSVTRIGDGAFTRASDLKFVLMREGVTEIGMSAFMLSGVEKLNIPKSTTNIGSIPTVGCNNLKEIVVADGNPSYYSAGNCLIDSAAKSVIAGCSSSVIPDSEDVTSIADSVFYYFVNLKNVKIPSNVTSLGVENFSFCSNIETVTVASGNPVYHSAGDCLIETASKTLILGSKNSVIPNDGSVETIASTAFAKRNGPTTLTIPGTIKTIEEYAFEDATNISTIIIESGVDYVDEFGFYKSSVEKVIIKGSINTIKQSVFSDCFSLKEVVLEDGFDSIAPAMFDGSALEKITIPTSLTEICSLAFRDCDNLKNIYYEGTKAQWNALSFNENWNKNSGNYTIHCTDGDIAKA